MVLAEIMGLEKVIFESDSAKVVEAIWVGTGGNEVDGWRRWCLEELSNHEGWHVNLIRREANCAANVLAKVARDTGLSWIESDACPIFLGPCCRV